MINVHNFLLDNTPKEEIGVYALVTYEGKTEATYFSKQYDNENNLWFSENPCELWKERKCNNPYSKEWKDYFRELLKYKSEKSVNNYIKKYIEPMIVNVFYMK